MLGKSHKQTVSNVFMLLKSSQQIGSQGQEFLPVQNQPTWRKKGREEEGEWGGEDDES